jgi:plastocyanin
MVRAERNHYATENGIVRIRCGRFRLGQCVRRGNNHDRAGRAFSETDVSIKAGDHIKFANQDDVNHNILVQEGDDDDNAKDMGVQAPGASVDVPFDKSGKFKIRCHIHPSMKLNVDVQ